MLITAPEVDAVHIADLDYLRFRTEMESALDGSRASDPLKSITLADGSDLLDPTHGSEFVAITGSALCNRTLEPVLASVGAGARVVVQGQSAAIEPAAMFDRGVAAVMTTVKPPALVAAAAARIDGSAMRPLLEVGSRGCTWSRLRAHDPPSPRVRRSLGGREGAARRPPARRPSRRNPAGGLATETRGAANLERRTSDSRTGAKQHPAQVHTGEVLFVPGPQTD